MLKHLKRVVKGNWFNTLNESLDSEGLVDLWPLGLNLGYNETASCAVDGTFMTVYRDSRGMYERVVHYPTDMRNVRMVVSNEYGRHWL